MNRTPQQQALIQELLNGTGHIALVARAGTGKTTTILEGVDEYVKVFPGHDITICCFGKEIQQEIAAKLVARGHTDWRKVQASTSHSMGFGLIKFVFKPTVNNDKVRDLLRAQNAEVFSTYFSQVCQLVHLAKLEGFGFFDDCPIGDAHAWYRMADHYSVNDYDDTSEMDRVIEAAQHIYRLSLQQTNVVDYDDMVLFPLIKNIRVKFTRDLIALDEAQDTSRARRALIKKFLKPDGRLMIVGDDRQAIMGFAGASADAMDELIQDLQPVVLPLNVSWRCPKAVIAEAQKIVPDITAADGAIEGSVTQIAELPAELEKTDAILCRNNAPLVETAYSLIRRGIACKVEGREIGTNLLNVVNRWKRITTIGAFLDKLEDYRSRETQKAMAKGKESKVQEINDRCDTLIAICSAVRIKHPGNETLDLVRAFIAELFQDNVKGVLTLCSYHKSKGREWPRVMLFQHGSRCPSKWAKQKWELQQEKNLAYVAITRSQRDLIFVA